MNAPKQYRLAPADLETVLALVRAGTLAGAAERLCVDASTVFRALQRLERGLGETLFERRRTGLSPTERAQALAARGEQLEALMEAARGGGARGAEPVAGTVRITTTDTIRQRVDEPDTTRRRHRAASHAAPASAPGGQVDRPTLRELSRDG